jgi:hypothetical protein
MAGSDKPRSPFAAMADLSARTPVRVLSPDEIEQMLVSHQLYPNLSAENFRRLGASRSWHPTNG